MTIIISLFTIATLICMIITIYVFRKLNQANAEYKTKWAALGNYQFDGEKPNLPELAFIKRDPLVIQIGRKHIYMKPLSIIKYFSFINDFTTFLLQLKRYDLKIEFLSKDEIPADKLVMYSKEVEKMMQYKDLYKEYSKIISKYILSDEMQNPEGVTINDFFNYVEPLDLLHVLFQFKVFNVDSVKKKAKRILENLGLGNLDTYSSSSKGNTDSATENSFKPLYPQYSSWAKEEQRTVLYQNQRN